MKKCVSMKQFLKKLSLARARSLSFSLSLSRTHTHTQGTAGRGCQDEHVTDALFADGLGSNYIELSTDRVPSSHADSRHMTFDEFVCALVRLALYILGGSGPEAGMAFSKVEHFNFFYEPLYADFSRKCIKMYEGGNV